MINVLIVLLSFVALLWAANHLVTGALGIAHYYQISPLVMGLSIVALGTSAPEITVALNAAFEGRSDLALGNAIGANIANIGLVLGLTILVRPLTLKSTLLRREFPLLFLIMLFMYSLMLDGYFSVIDGCLLLVGCLALIAYFVYLAHHSKRDRMAREFTQTVHLQRPMKASLFSFVLGLLVLPFSGHLLVNRAVLIGHAFGISDLVLGLTLISLGTCIPNITAAMMAAFKGHDDLAVGTILGSNMFNLLIVMAWPGIIDPSSINHTLLWRDIPVMILITGVLFWINKHPKRALQRWHGGLLLVIYGCYMITLLANVLEH